MSAAVAFHVAPWGDDSAPGTPERPLAGPHGALRAVRAALARTPGGCGDVLVTYRAGTYALPEPLDLGSGDGGSGPGGRRVTHQPYGYGTDAAESVVFSGGAPVTGWTPVGDGTWRAGTGSLEPRQLYVDDRRAHRAGTPHGASPLPGTVTKTETGYVTDSTAPQAWRSPASIEFVFRGVYPWSEARLRVASISGDARSTTFTLAEPGFSRANALYAAEVHGGGAREESGGASWGRLGLPTSAENSPSFLTEPGTFALDTSVPGHHTLHYLPLPGEDPAAAVFTIPLLERLLTARGAAGITLRGLTFAHAAWQRPSAPGGFPHYHGNTFQDEGPLERVDLFDGAAHLVVPGAPARVPSAVDLRDCADLVLRDNTFTHLGAGAVAVEGGGAGTALVGNVVEDVSGPGISVDSADGVRVEDNLLRDIGAEFHGSSAVWVSDARDVVVAHNEIHDVPYSGIVVMGGDRAARVRVTENLVRRSLLVLADGGGVYLAGRQGDSYASGTLVRGNVLLDVVTPYNFGLYTDYACSWTTVLGNVVRGADTPALLRPALPLENVAFVGNFWDAHPEGDDDPPPGVVYAANTVLPGGGTGLDGRNRDADGNGDASGSGTDGLPTDIVAAAGRSAQR